MAEMWGIKKLVFSVESSLSLNFLYHINFNQMNGFQRVFRIDIKYQYSNIVFTISLKTVLFYISKTCVRFFLGMSVKSNLGL